MSFTATSLQCIECGNTFISPAAEQEYFQNKGYFYEPKRCPSCLQAKKHSVPWDFCGRRQMYPAVCAKCDKDTEVPFEPRDGIPVYCSGCYSRITQSRY